MEDLKKLKEQYAAKINEAKVLAATAGSEPMSKELADKVTALLGQGDEIKARIDVAQRIADGDEYLNAPAGTQAAHLGFRQAGPDEGNAEVDVKAWRSFELPIMGHSGWEKKSVRYHIPIAVQTKAYTPAFEAYLRNGKADLGPNDRKALSEGLDSAGGYLVPEEFHAEIIKKVATFATMRQYARVATTSRDVAKWPRIKYTTNNEYTSAVRLTWTGETPSSSTAARVTDQVFGEFNIPVHTAMASQLISADLIEDAAFDVLGISSELFGEAFGLGENDAFWNGTGAGQPRGLIIDASDTTNFDAAVATAGASNAIDADEVIDVVYALPAQYERNARVFMTKGTEKYIRKLKDSSSNYVWPVWHSVGGFGVAPMELLGFPVVRDEFIDEISTASITTTYPIIVADLTGYIVLDRVGLSIKRDDSLYSETNQVLLLGRKRVGGQLVEGYRVSMLKTVNST